MPRYEELIEIVNDYIHLEMNWAPLSNDVESSSIRNDIRRFSTQLQSLYSNCVYPSSAIPIWLQRVLSPSAQAAERKSVSILSVVIPSRPARDRSASRSADSHDPEHGNHGIETPEQRVMDKVPEGTLTIEAIRDLIGSSSIADDGRGIDPAKEKPKPLKRIITRPQADIMMMMRLKSFSGFLDRRRSHDPFGSRCRHGHRKICCRSYRRRRRCQTHIGKGTKITLTMPLSRHCESLASLSAGRCMPFHRRT